MPRYKKVERKIYIRRRIFVILVIILLLVGIYKINSLIFRKIDSTKVENSQNTIDTNTFANSKNVMVNVAENVIEITSTSIQRGYEDWQIILVNSNNILPENYEVELANIDSIRQFDKRAINELNQMINDMRKAGIKNIWVQSAYRSVSKQKELFNNSVKKYMKQRKK